MNFHRLTIGGCPFSKEHRWRFFSTVTYWQKSEVFMIVIMIGTTFLFCDMGWSKTKESVDFEENLLEQYSASQ